MHAVPHSPTLERLGTLRPLSPITARRQALSLPCLLHTRYGGGPNDNYDSVVVGLANEAFSFENMNAVRAPPSLSLLRCFSCF